MADTQTIFALIGLAIFDGLLVFGFWLYVHIDSRRTMDRITRMGIFQMEDAYEKARKILEEEDHKN